jgi:hypothetical protein
MFKIKEKTVNRKQFHYLICKFLLERGLTKRFFDSSLRYKLKTIEQGKAYYRLYKKYNFSKHDTFSEHLYKCIDIYCGERDVCFSTRPFIDLYYGGTICGFFRLVPATFDEDYVSFWQSISIQWEKETKGIKFDYGHN